MIVFPGFMTLESYLLKPCDHNIKHTIRLTREMIRLANRGDADREDIGCGVLYGVLRDSAYKILQLAEAEKERHQAKGWWQEARSIQEGGDDRTGKNNHPKR